jgi:hypothetical protein
MAAQLVSISAASNGSVWGIAADGTLLNRDEQHQPPWRSLVDGMNFTRVAASNSGKIWCLDAQGRVFCSEDPAGKPFTEAPGAELISIAVGADATICGVDRKGQALRYDEAREAWSPLPPSGALAKVTVGNADDICAVDGQGLVYQLVAEKWEEIGQGFSDVDVGPDGALWALRAGGKLFVRLGSEWRDTGKTFRSISAGDPPIFGASTAMATPSTGACILGVAAARDLGLAAPYRSLLLMSRPMRRSISGPCLLPMTRSTQPRALTCLSSKWRRKWLRSRARSVKSSTTSFSPIKSTAMYFTTRCVRAFTIPTICRSTTIPQTTAAD